MIPSWSATFLLTRPAQIRFGNSVSLSSDTMRYSSCQTGQTGEEFDEGIGESDDGEIVGLESGGGDGSFSKGQETRVSKYAN